MAKGMSSYLDYVNIHLTLLPGEVVVSDVDQVFNYAIFLPAGKPDPITPIELVVAGKQRLCGPNGVLALPIKLPGAILAARGDEIKFISTVNGALTLIGLRRIDLR